MGDNFPIIPILPTALKQTYCTVKNAVTPDYSSLGYTYPRMFFYFRIIQWVQQRYVLWGFPLKVPEPSCLASRKRSDVPEDPLKKYVPYKVPPIDKSTLFGHILCSVSH